MSEEIKSIHQSFSVGTPIKYKNRQFGVVTEIRYNYVYFVYHNGMKPRHSFGTVDQIKKISLESFKRYVARSGNNSLSALFSNGKKVIVNYNYA